MKKYSKIITIALCLTLIFTMFSGFTYKSVDVQNLGTVRCSSCGGSGYCDIGICDAPNNVLSGCIACNGTGICYICNGTGTVEGSTNPTPTPKPTPNPTKCIVSGIIHINDNAYEIDVNNYVGDNLKLEFLATSSKGHTLTYTWKNNDITIAGANTNTYTSISSVLGNHKYSVTATCATCSVNSQSYTNVNTTDVENTVIVAFKKFNDGFLFFDSTTTLSINKFTIGKAVGIEYDFIGANFSHYSTDKQGLEKVPNDYKITKDTILYVNYKAVENAEIKYFRRANKIVNSGTMTPEFEFEKAVSVLVGSNFVPYKVKGQWQDVGNKFYDFKEWTFDKEGKEKVPENYIVTENITLYAQYTTEPVVEKTALSQLWDYIVQFVGWVVTTVVSVLNWIFALFA